jgi:hypothetical protein
MTGEGTLDTTRPNVARVYDHLLGGSGSFAADREQGRPPPADLPDIARRGPGEPGLHRPRRHLGSAAGDQPVRRPRHRAARAVTPDAWAAYVDSDPFVNAHVRALLAGGDSVASVSVDPTNPAG